MLTALFIGLGSIGTRHLKKSDGDLRTARAGAAG